MIDPMLNDKIAERFKPFQDEILRSYKDNIHFLEVINISTFYHRLDHQFYKLEKHY